ncbi:MAG: WGR domain-containing protein [Verrucomicrobiae bacterium]|nr:WGR domain-containing protein [Verrucomicrobiae bacterium]
MNPTHDQDRITLYYREGASDKVYQAAIEPSNGGFVVNFAYGRRGAPLQCGTKTQSPVSYQEAKAIYTQLVQSKTAKGYTPGQDGTPYAQTAAGERVSGIHCQLLNAIDADAVDPFLDDTAYLMQEKFDGKRLLLQKTGQAVTGINRKGLITGIPTSLRESALAYPHDFLMDGEAIGDTLHAFDLLSLDGRDIRTLPYEKRLVKLLNLASSGQGRDIRVAQSWRDPHQKRHSLETLRKINREGVVFKDYRAPYTAGRPASGGSQLKYKFTQTATFIVTGINRQRSVSLSLYSKGAKNRLVDAGHVTIPANRKIPPLGATVEVRYLYAFPDSGKIYQPFYLGQRDDVEAGACSVKQLKYRSDPEEEDEV